MEILEINLTGEEIKSKSKVSFKKIIKEKTKQVAFKYLMKKKSTHSKLDDLKYTELKIQPYLSTNALFKDDAQLLFKLRTRMADFKANFKNGNIDLTCFSCPSEDRQDHILTCDLITSNIPEASTVKYETIFSNKPHKMLDTIKVIKKALQYREKRNS